MNLPIPDPLVVRSAPDAPSLRISIQLQDALETWYLTRTLETAAHMAGRGQACRAPHFHERTGDRTR